MATLKAATRNRLPPGDFAGPDRSYPDEDAGHARAALSRVANKSPALKARVRAKVKRDYPGIKQGNAPRRRMPGTPSYPKEANEYVK